MDDDKQIPRPSHALTVWMSVAACLLLTYCLSIGPVVGLAARGYLGSAPYPFLHQFYAPMFYLQDHNEVAAGAMEWYESQFVPISPPISGPLTKPPSP